MDVEKKMIDELEIQSKKCKAVISSLYEREILIK
jgi:hypothetical protein